MVIFDKTDLYTVSSGIQLFNYWNPVVTKHDTSSFYNWEQDNLPNYDLEERDYELWERLGFPTSSLPGLALVVSGTNAGANPNVFTTLQGAIDALPEILNFPTLIEVAVSGDLGDIQLNNIKCTNMGALEIINRAHLPYDSDASANGPTGLDTNTSAILRTSVSQSETIDNFVKTVSALSVSANVSSLFGYSNYSNTVRTFVGVPHRNIGAARTVKNRHVKVGISNNVNVKSAITTWQVPDYAGTLLNQILDPTRHTLEVSAFSELTGDSTSFINRLCVSGTAPLSNCAVGMLTTNYATRFEIENCDGPIYIRGFIVDGASGVATPEGNYHSDVGFTVKNSSVTLENCGVMRCRRSGAEFYNSDVILRRRFITARNFEVTGATGRHSRENYGIRAFNSTISATSDSSSLGQEFIFWSHYQKIGVDLINSQLLGGDSRKDHATETTISFGYNETSLRAKDSVVDIKGRFDVYNSLVGIEAENSTLKFDELTVENNQKEGIKAKNSTIIYNSQLNRAGTNGNDTITDTPTYEANTHFYQNGQHLNLVNSNFIHLGGDQLQDKFGALRFQKHHGVITPGTVAGNLTSRPGIILDNSIAHFVHARLQTNESAFATKEPVLGALVQAINGSEAVFKGSVKTATVLVGPDDYLSQEYVAGVYADSGSKVAFRGPTVIARFGIDVLVERGSTVEFTPHRKEDLSLDVSSWNLSDTGNHTSIELHSTRACLVAAKNSTINLRDLGDYHAAWDRTTLGAVVSSSDYSTGAENDEFDSSSYHSAGSLNFYPNPFDGDTVGPRDNPVGLAGGLVENYVPGTGDIFRSASVPIEVNYYIQNPWGAISESNIRNELSVGGMCIRAVEDSVVEARNVHFPCGFSNASGSFLDPSSSPAGCNDLMIWNIADSSKLHASYLTVSGQYPSLAGYSGPRAVYMSGTEAPAYNAKSGTPNTGMLSVLDFYGSGSPVRHGEMDTFFSGLSQSIHGSKLFYGQTGFENKGPFRIYFGVDPIGKMMAYASGTNVNGTPDPTTFVTIDTKPYQHLAQGYNLSATTSALNEFSSVGATLLQLANNGTSVDTSGYYYPSSLTVDKATVWLDESAANTFANAKNAAFPYSGRKQLVNIYRATTSPYGEGYNSDTSGYGNGLRSVNLFDIRRKL